MDRSLRTMATERELIAEQARKVRALYPELFAALDERDRNIRSALYRIPHPADPEALVPPQVVERALQTLRQCKTGIGDLCDEGQ
jgi:DNA-directed RNA polymerase subunit L